jgi:hypothetical protein
MGQGILRDTTKMIGQGGLIGIPHDRKLEIIQRAHKYYDALILPDNMPVKFRVVCLVIAFRLAVHKKHSFTRKQILRELRITESEVPDLIAWLNEVFSMTKRKLVTPLIRGNRHYFVYTIQMPLGYID